MQAGGQEFDPPHLHQATSRSEVANDTGKKVSAEMDAEHPQKLTVPRSGIQGVMRGSAKQVTT